MQILKEIFFNCRIVENEKTQDNNQIFSVDITQVDENGPAFGPKTDRKCLQYGYFTAVSRLHTVRFRSTSHCIIWRRSSHRIISVS